MKRTTWGTLTVLLGLLGVAASAADVFETYRLARDNWSSSLITSMTGPAFATPSVSQALKAVPPAQRAAVVRALGDAARAYVQTPEFAAAYAEVFSQLPETRRTPRTKVEVSDRTKADMQKMLADMEKSAASIPPEQRKMFDAALVQAKKEMAEQMKQLDQMAAQSAREERADAQANAEAATSDPQATLRKALNRFLTQTADVDFAATTLKRGGLARFTNDAFEAKPAAWKMCYRAGSEACGEARAIATAWLAGK